MGLDATHDAWHGGYIAFGLWRKAVARAAGYPIGQRDGGGYSYILDFSSYVPENYMGHWHKRELEDPLLYLLVHSDCEGKIKPKHAALIADRLQELLPLIEASGAGMATSHHEDTLTFIDGLRLAVSEGKAVKFR